MKPKESKMDRTKLLNDVVARVDAPWDVVVIGGGATGLGIAVDAATRGFSVVLLEKIDFAKGTSSRSTKLLHGGVRYLAQGNIRLVREALKERGRLMRNAKTIVSNRTFVVPAYRWWEIPFYWIGLKLYDLLSGRRSIGQSKYISKTAILQAMPGIQSKGLLGGITYHDGQFDDAEMALAMARTAVAHGGKILNHCGVTQIEKREDGFEIGFTDALTGQFHSIKSQAVFNATGVFVDQIMRMENESTQPFIAPSQGIHLVVDRHFLNSQHALMIPKTTDGRVLFGVPWHNKVLLGTTDSPVDKPSYEPRAMDEEISFVLQNASMYLDHPPTRSDIRSIFVGLRPLVAPANQKKTKEISRGHKIIVSKDKMVTIIGGKWTTYRQMAEDALDRAMGEGILARRPCQTYELALQTKEESVLAEIKAESEDNQRKLSPDFDFTVADVVYAIRCQMACTIEDVLARRVRLLFLDAKLAQQLAPDIGQMLHKERGQAYNLEKDLQSFYAICDQYLIENFNLV